MTTADFLIILSIVTMIYFAIGLLWAVVMHRRIVWEEYSSPYAKGVIFFFNLNIWPECMAIWLGLPVYKFAKMNVSKGKMSSITMEQLLANQKALNKENQGNLK